MNQMKRRQLYVLAGSVITASGTKTEVQAKLGHAIVGPFKSRKGADYFKTNPSIGSVTAAERAGASRP